jgi:hypothetical protein
MRRRGQSRISETTIVMAGGTQDRVDSSYLKHLQQRAQDLRAQLKRCLTNAEANRNNGHAMDNFLVQAARLRKQIATTERRLEACKTRETDARESDARDTEIREEQAEPEHSVT